MADVPPCISYFLGGTQTQGLARTQARTGPGPGPGCGPGSETRDLGTGNGSGPKALNQDPENQTESRRTRVSDPRRDLILVLFIVCRFLFLLLICVQSLKKYQTWSPK